MFKMEIQSASDGRNEFKRNPDFTISIVYRNFVIDYFAMKKLLILVLVLLFSGILRAQEQQVVVPYTIADRDRAIRTEANMELKFESQQRQLDDIKTFFYWGFGIMITLLIFMFGYMIWDRRTAMQPALEKSMDAEAKSANLIRALRDYSKKHADLAEILKSHGIL